MVKTFDMKVHRRNKQPDWAREVEKVVIEVGGRKWEIKVDPTDGESVILGLQKPDESKSS